MNILKFEVLITYKSGHSEVVFIPMSEYCTEMVALESEGRLVSMEIL